jgi:hypothetical protein
MHTTFQDYIDRLAALHQGVLAAIESLSTEALDWIPLASPINEMNSINVLVTHLTGAERYWIGDVALGEISGRIREAEFRVRGKSTMDLAVLINTATEYAQSAVTKLSLEDLTVERTSSRDGRVFTVGWALMHALEHTALHLGHIQVTRQLWDEKT